MFLQNVVYSLLIFSGFCDGFIDLLLGQGHNFDQLNPYGNLGLAGTVNVNPLLGRSRFQPGYLPAGQQPNQLGIYHQGQQSAIHLGQLGIQIAGQAHPRFQQGHGLNNPGLLQRQRQRQLLRLQGQRQGRLRHLGGQGQRQRPGFKGHSQGQPQNFLEIVQSGSEYQVAYKDEAEDYHEPVYATNGNGEVVVVNGNDGHKHSAAKIGGLTSLIGGHIGGHGGHLGGHGGHLGIHGGGHLDHGFDLHETSHYEHDHGHSVAIVLKKSKKKKKIITTQHGFYIPGGTAMFGKFKDLHSCKKACSITATCFAGDFDPWLGKCFLHTNITACQTLRAHPSVIHFSKIPCDMVESRRGLVTLGTQIFSGLEQLGIKDLKTCLKKCAIAGGGIAPTTDDIPTTPQLCFGIDYDFATHKCYFHTDPELCPAVDPIPTPAQLSPNPSSVNILICPLVA